MFSPYRFVTVFTMLLGGFLAYGQAQAHCDSLDGPVVQDARIALEKGDPFPVLKWVDKDHEDEIATLSNRRWQCAPRAVTRDHSLTGISSKRWCAFTGPAKARRLRG
jgi:hypothetical protein